MVNYSRVDRLVCFINKKQTAWLKYCPPRRKERILEFADILSFFSFVKQINQWRLAVFFNPLYKFYRSSTPGLPIAAYDDLSAFKIYLVDVGLLRRLAQLAPTAFGEGNRLFIEFKGALTENFVLQTLITQFEVKSETNTTSKSMKKFKELFPEKVKLRIRFSLDHLKLDDDVLNIPLFMADQADRLIGLALEKQSDWQK